MADENQTDAPAPDAAPVADAARAPAEDTAVAQHLENAGDELVKAVKAVPSAAANAAADLEAWMKKHIHNTLISRDTGLFNAVHAAKESLKGFLAHLDA